jgi:hypothetical protein
VSFNSTEWPWKTDPSKGTGPKSFDHLHQSGLLYFSAQVSFIRHRVSGCERVLVSWDGFIRDVGDNRFAASSSGDGALGQSV